MNKRFFYAKTKEEFVEEISNDINDYKDSMKKGAQECGVCISDNDDRGEVGSWVENAKALSPLLCKSNLPDDIIVAFEYQVPIGGGRIDCMLFGVGEDGKANIVHIELKQWSNKNVSPFYNHYTFHVVVDGYRSGTEYPTHPSRQVSAYHNCLLNYLPVFKDKDIELCGLAYCYNYLSAKEPCALLDDFYSDEMKQFPLYCKDQEDELAIKLNTLLGKGNGRVIYEDFLGSKICPTQRLYDVAANMFNGLDDTDDKIFTLIGDQVDTYNNILGAVKSTKQDEKKVIIVKGGPGTGKSVIALRLLSELYKEDYNCKNVFYATRSTSLRNGWKNVLADIARKKGDGNVASLIQSTFDFKPYRYGNKENGGDVLLVDEAHRIENKSNDQTDSSRDDEDRSYLSQIMSILYSTRVCVFFIDDKQSIKSKEIGTSIEIRKAAESYYQRMLDETDYFFIDNKKNELKEEKKAIVKALKKARKMGDEKKLHNLQENLEKIDNHLKFKNRSDYEKEGNVRMVQLPRLTPAIHKIDVEEFELKDQFRCNGSNNYLYWLDQLLYDSNNPQKIKLNTDFYKFGIYDDPNELYAKIRSLDEYAAFADAYKKQMQDGFSYNLLQIAAKNEHFNQSARLIAGWCWKWDQKKLETNGDLEHEVVIIDPAFRFEMPWETASSEGAKKPKGDFSKKYAKDADSWCNQREGVNQIGCIHSIQGWETDYVGVIIGPDLMWDDEKKRLCYNPQGGNHDLSKSSNEKNDQLILNTYRVLLTRGKKGCFIFCCNPGVRDYFRRCMEQ